MVDENRVRELYVEYNTVIKPLIAEVEARMEQFPLPIFNEIRALHDHISRCYSDNITDAQIEKELEKGKRHVVRIILDCYKYLYEYPQFPQQEIRSIFMVNLRLQSILASMAKYYWILHYLSLLLSRLKHSFICKGVIGQNADIH